MKEKEKSKDSGKIDLGSFLSAHSKEELLELKHIIDGILDSKKSEESASSKRVNEKALEKTISETKIPISIFKEGLSPAESLVKYLKENQQLRLCEISRLINSKENTLWLNYKRAMQKKSDMFVASKNETSLPLAIFQKNKLSYLEAIVIYLRDEMNLSNKKVSTLLDKSPQIISIAYNRAKSKKSNSVKNE